MPIITGLNEDVDAGTETIWSQGGLWLPPTAARVHAIVSTDVDDNSGADTGARTVLVTGILASGVRASETVTLHATDGTIAVNTANAYTHIEELRVLTAGSSLGNEGTITATAATDSTVSATITIARNVSSACVLYNATPGQQLRLDAVTVSATLLGAATVSHHVWLLVKPLASLITRIPLGCLYSGASSVLNVPIGIVLGYNEWARIDVTSSAADSDVAGLIQYTQVA